MGSNPIYRRYNPLPWIAETFPISMKLNVLNRENWAYLLLTAVLTRMVIGLMRINENRPVKNKDPNLTQNQKRQAFLERFFVEFGGTAAYIGALHLGQDVMAKVFEHTSSKLDLNALQLPYPEPHGCPPHGLSRAEIDHINLGMKEVFGKVQADGKTFALDNQGLIYRALFGQKVGNKTVKANLVGLRENLEGKATGLYEKAAKAYGATPESLMKTGAKDTLAVTGGRLAELAMSLNRYSNWSIAAGVGLSALFGGLVTQRVNDNVVAPQARRWLTRSFREGNVLPATFNNNSTLLQPTVSTPATPRTLNLLSSVGTPSLFQNPSNALPFATPPVSFASTPRSVLAQTPSTMPSGVYIPGISQFTGIPVAPFVKSCPPVRTTFPLPYSGGL